MGLVLIVLAVFVAIMPFQMPSPGGDPFTQLYQASKGGMIAAAQAYSNAAGFLKCAAVLAFMGVFMLAFSAARHWRHSKAWKSDSKARKTR